MTISSNNYLYLKDVFDLSKKLDAHALKFLSASVVEDDIIEKTNKIIAFFILSHLI